MDIAITAGSRITIRHRDGTARQFARLTVADLGELQEAIPGPPGSGRFVTLFELYRWAQTPEGAGHVLRLSLRRLGGDHDEAQIEAMGSILDRVDMAQAIMGASITTGEATQEQMEQAAKDTNGPKARGPETGPKKRS